MHNNNNPSDLKDQVANLASEVKRDAQELANDVKESANELGDNLQKKGKSAKNEANNVIASLKTLLADYTDSSKAAEFKDQIIHKAAELKHVMQDEVAQAYEAGKARTIQTLQDKPITSIAVAAGVGLLIGYILGAKNSSK